LKPLVGAAPTATPPRPQQPAIANVAAPAPPRPTLLTKNAANILIRLERMMDEARQSLPPLAVSAAEGLATTNLQNPASLASASDREPGSIQGN
jgi:hypothetical protein